VLIAFDRGADRGPFDERDEQALLAFGSSAAAAVCSAQQAARGPAGATLARTEAERRRWAGQLHDRMLQALGGMHVLLASARRAQGPGALAEAADGVLGQLEAEIASLRVLIDELHPVVLDELGLGAALESLVDRYRHGGMRVTAAIEVAADAKLGGERGSALYRVAEEALANASRHARGAAVAITVGEQDGELVLEVSDDGDGFDAERERAAGHGLSAMRRRVLTEDGELWITSSAAGTLVRASVPLERARLRVR
jgi:signal transduction histidine kinase